MKNIKNMMREKATFEIYNIKVERIDLSARKNAFSKRKKLTAKDCKEIYEEAINENEQARNNHCLRKSYIISTFYKCLRNKGDTSPHWGHSDHKKMWDDEVIQHALDLFSQNPTLTRGKTNLF